MIGYDFLAQQFKTYYLYKDVEALMSWDSATMMSRGSMDIRGEQLSLLKLEAQKILTNPAIQDAVAKAESQSGLDEWQQANLREMKRILVHETAVDPKLVAEFTKLGNESEIVWREARKANDLPTMLGYYEKMFNLARTIGEAKAERLNTSPYEALVDEFDPGSDCTRIDAIFDDLSAYLPNVINQIIEKQAQDPALPLTGQFPVESQKKIGLSVMEALKFDFNMGRLDVSTHPFCGGSTNDVRITTRYKDNEFFSSLLGVIHETGHALYEQGLPEKYIHQPVGMMRGMGVHESQSLFYEKQIGRSNHFMRYMIPQLKAEFKGEGPSWGTENLLKLNHKVSKSLIRVEADEVTYPLHIILRYRIEKGLIEKKYSAKDIPELWNTGIQELLGVTPATPHDGCLQDIHWPQGAIGYFPSYTMGALIAAQLFQTMKKGYPEVEEDMGKGQFDRILSWLRENIHQYGSLYTQHDLVEKATGKSLGTEAFKQHIEARYLGA